MVMVSKHGTRPKKQTKAEKCHQHQKEHKISVFLPEVASITVETPLRSETGREEPGMLTGSERTGWILNKLRVTT